MGNIINAAALWGIVSVLTKLGDPIMVGQIELGRTITMPILAFTMLHLRVAQVTDAKNEYAFADYLGMRLATTVIGFLFIVVIGLGWYGGTKGMVVALWGLAKSIDAISDIIRGLFQRYERMDFGGISLIARSVCALAAVTAIIYLWNDLILAIISIIFVWLLTLFIYDFPRAHRVLTAQNAEDGIYYKIRPRFSPETMLALLRLSLPLGVIMFMLYLQSSIPRGVLEAYHGESSLGYFGPILYPVMLGALTVNALGQSASPRLAQYYNSKISHYRRLMLKLLLLGVAGGLLFIAVVTLFGKWILTILYTAQYAKYHNVFVILAVGAALSFISSFCGYGLAATRKFKLILLLKIFPCAASVGISFWTIPRYGIIGAAITSVAVFSVGLLCSFTALIWLTKKRSEDLENKEDKYIHRV